MVDRAVIEPDTVPSGLRGFVSQRHGLFIDGRWQEPHGPDELPVFDPSTAQQIGTVGAASAADVDRAVAAAAAAFDGPWARTRPAVRSRLLHRLADLVGEHAEEFAVLEALDVGKPVAAARAGDVPGAIAVLRYFAGWTDKIEGNTLQLSLQAQGEFHAFTLREPVGVCAGIVPWNYPLVTAVWKLAPALACGCTVVLKPAEETVLSTLRLAQLVEEVGFPPGTVNVLPGSGEVTGAALVRHPGVQKVAFTGSTEVGRLVAHAAAEKISRVSLELGGKSANIVFADADLELAIAGSARGIFNNAGQSCGSGSRLFVEESVFDEVVDGIRGYAAALKVGGGLEEGSQLGPIITEEQRDRIHGFVSDAAATGADVVCGGSPVEREGWFYAPTIVTGAEPAMPIVTEEVFGPVLVAMAFKDLDDVLRQANDSRYGLAGGAWTSDLSKAFRVIRGLRAGRLFVNCWGVIDPTLPVGGFKDSGIGREMGHAALDLYTEVKAACVRVGPDARPAPTEPTGR